jgi:hypothetical protein
MRTKNKDFEVEFKEWWEVAKKYFTKEMEKNLAQHITDEKILRYKLEVYQNNFPDFIFDSPTSIKVSNQNEEKKNKA